MKNNFCIVTATFYPSGSKESYVRSVIAIETIKKAVQLHFPIIVLDSGSFPEFIHSIFLPEVIVIQNNTNGMGFSRRAVIREAQKRGFEAIIWLEPEKQDLIKDIPYLVNPILLGMADMVIPKRKSLGSYPFFQQITELLLNFSWIMITHADFDISFGPRAFSNKAASYFLEYTGTYGDKWDSLFIPVMKALRDRLKIISIPVAYRSDQKQTKFENMQPRLYIKRLEQLFSLIWVIWDYWSK